MTRAPLLKVYGHLCPADAALAKALDRATSTALPSPEDALITHKNTLICLSFEGVYFPLEESLDALRQHLSPALNGKIDYIDLDAWTLTRHSIINGIVHIRSAPLNAVLEYAYTTP